jgi:hypothetical protein
MGKKTKVVVTAFIITVVVFFTYNYIMTGGARDLENEESEFTITAGNIFNEFTKDNDLATSKYLNKAVEISGLVTAANQNVIVLDSKVSCQLLLAEKVEINTQLKIKGRVTGYDDLLEELKLDQCLILK